MLARSLKRIVTVALPKNKGGTNRLFKTKD